MGLLTHNGGGNGNGGNNGGTTKARSGTDQGSTGTGRDSKGGQEAGRPARSERPGSAKESAGPVKSGNAERPKPNSQERPGEVAPSLAELRSVLASISGQTKEKKPERPQTSDTTAAPRSTTVAQNETVPSKRVDAVSSTHSHEQTKEQKPESVRECRDTRDTRKPSTGNQKTNKGAAADSPLRSALADVIKQAVPQDEAGATSSPAAPASVPAKERSQATTPDAAAPAQSPRVDKVNSSESSVSSERAELEVLAAEAEAMFASLDHDQALLEKSGPSPKVVKQMLRPRADRSPFS